MRHTPFVLAGGLCLALAACSDDGNPTEPVNDAPSVKLLTPNGGAVIAPSAAVAIAWEASDPNGDALTFDLGYLADGSAGVVSIAKGLTGTTHNWTAPAGALYGLRIKVTATDPGGLTAEDVGDGHSAVVNASARGYVTSTVCRTCHSGTYNNVRASGHPYKINKVINGQRPAYPSPVPLTPAPPVGYTWADITYVIGGYGYKTRFTDKDGFVITNGFNKVNSQYNMPRPDLALSIATGSWGAYEGSNLTRKPYDCGTCHTTGWQTVAENGGVRQDNLPGMAGTWEEPGVQCEACHGAGALHTASKLKKDVKVDRSSASCGSCHARNKGAGVEASGGFIRHHEQWEELGLAGHGELACVACHEPHIGTLYGNDTKGGIRVTCESCHPTKTRNAHLVPISCVSCHMPFAARTAVSQHTYAGDIKSHLFKINSDPVDRNAMWFTQGGKTWSRGWVTLDFACWGCHKNSDNGQGGTASARSLAELSFKARNIHNKP